MCMNNGNGGKMKNLNGAIKVKLTEKINTENVVFEFGDNSRYRNIDRFCERCNAQNGNWNWEKVEK